MITHLLSSSGYFGFKGAFSKEWRQNSDKSPKLRHYDVIMTSKHNYKNKMNDIFGFLAKFTTK